ncbi:unnamed protein product [Rotaria sp. Silwood2]|nr:unnamed protein product [Rotaria sp. Silwood2]CAF4367016.1 unnamed protein product [Rotaria sp. Silwood2]
MGNDTSKEKLIKDGNDIPKKKRYSILLRLSETKAEEEHIELNEQELQQVRDIYRRSSDMSIYSPFCFVR